MIYNVLSLNGVNEIAAKLTVQTEANKFLEIVNNFKSTKIVQIVQIQIRKSSKLSNIYSIVSA